MSRTHYIFLFEKRKHKQIFSNIYSQTIHVQQARAAGIIYRHCPNLEIDNTTVTDGIDTLVRVLQEVGKTGNQCAQDGEKTLLQVSFIILRKIILLK